MTQNTVKPTVKEAIKDQIALTLRHIDRSIASMAEKMNDDYLHFFEWTAESMFKAHKRRAFYAPLAEAIESQDEATDLSAWFSDIARRKSDALVRGCLTRNSTSPMMNHAHLLNLEVEQELIRDIEGLACAAEYYSK